MRLRFGLYALFWLLSPPVHAAAPEASLGLSEATALVLERSPRLQAADFDARAAAARIRQRSQSTPYVVGVEAENFGGSGRATGAEALDTTLRLSRVLELGDKPARRGEVALLEAGLLRHDRDAERLDLLAETARRFLELARVQAERELAEQRVELMRATVRAVERRYRLGKAPEAELNRANIDLARAEMLLEEVHHLLEVGRRRLAVTWGAFEPGFQRVSADLFAVEAAPAFATLERALARNPAIESLATAERLAAARVALARSRANADVSVGAGVRHFNETDDVGLVLSMQIPLGSGRRAEPYLSESEAFLSQTPLLAEDRRQRLKATLFALHQELQHARHQLETYRSRIIPAAERMEADYNEGYRAGRYALLELITARETLLEARNGALAAATDYHAARIEIDRLIGATPLNGASP